MSTISSKWTDDDLLYILIHTNGDLTEALETIIHHEATGRPPEALIRLLSAAEQSPRSHRRSSSVSVPETKNIQIQSRSRSRSQSVPNDSDRVGPGPGGGGSEPVALDMISSEGTVVPSLVSSISAPPTSSTPLLEGRGSASDFESELQSQPIIRNVPTNAHGMFYEGLQTGTITAASPSSSVDVVNHSTYQRTQGIDMNMNQSLSESRQRHIDEETKASESKHQQMLNMQSGIEASLKKTRNTSEIDADIDDKALSYAVKVTKKHSMKNTTTKRYA